MGDTSIKNGPIHEARDLQHHSWDLFLTLFCALFASVISVIIISDFSLLKNPYTEAVEKRQVIARLTQVRNNVRHQTSQIPFWSKIAGPQDLNLEDQVFSDEDSTAHIVFNDKTEISMAENSLIQIERQGSDAVINLLKGDLVATTPAKATPLIIQVGSQKVKFKAVNARLKIAKDEKNRLQIDVKAGQLHPSTRGSEAALSAGSSQTFNEQGEITQERHAAVVLTAPLENEFFFADQPLPVALKRSKAGAPVVARIFLHEGGKKSPVREERLKQDIVQLSPLAPGRYSIELADSGSDTTVAQETFFAVIANQPIELASPQDGVMIQQQPHQEKLDAPPIKKTARVALSFIPQPEYQTYEIEIKDLDRATTSLIKLTGSPHIAELAAPRQIAWRVRGVKDKKLRSRWSETRKVVIVKQMPQLPTKEPTPTPSPAVTEPSIEKLPPPKIKIRRSENTDDNGTFFNPMEILWSLFGATAYAAEDVLLLEWEAVPGAIGYQVQIATDNAFTHLVKSERVSTVSYDLRRLTEGKYFFRIGSINKKEEIGDFSDPFPVDVIYPEPFLIKPPHGAELSTTQTGEKISFSWRIESSDPECRFELADDASFTNIILKKEKVHALLKVELSPIKDAYWRIGCRLSRQGQLKFSRKRRISLIRQPPPVAVQIPQTKPAQQTIPVPQRPPEPPLRPAATISPKQPKLPKKRALPAPKRSAHAVADLQIGAFIAKDTILYRNGTMEEALQLTGFKSLQISYTHQLLNHYRLSIMSSWFSTTIFDDLEQRSRAAVSQQKRLDLSYHDLKAAFHYAPLAHIRSSQWQPELFIAPSYLASSWLEREPAGLVTADKAPTRAVLIGLGATYQSSFNLIGRITAASQILNLSAAEGIERSSYHYGQIEISSYRLFDRLGVTLFSNLTEYTLKPGASNPRSGRFNKVAALHHGAQMNILL
jgi:hypothetical protein